MAGTSHIMTDKQRFARAWIPDQAENACLMTFRGFGEKWFTIGGRPPADGEGGRIEKMPVERTELEFDRPLLFLEARTDTWVFRRPG
jgi:hypothetical protein